MAALLEQIKEKYSKLSKGQKRLADFLQSSYEQAAFMTAATLGERVGVSESTVVRFAMVLGFDGYPQLQKQLRELLKSRLTTVQRADMAVGMNREEALKTVLTQDANAIRDTQQGVDELAFERAVEKILGARRVYVLGLRSAMPLAQLLSYYLDFVCDYVMFINGAVQDIRERMVRISSEDVLIGIGFPRYDAKTVAVMNRAKSRGIGVIALTDRTDGPVAEAADIVLCAKTSMVSFVDSLTAPLSVINALLVALGLSRPDEVKKHLQQLENVWDEEETYL